MQPVKAEADEAIAAAPNTDEIKRLIFIPTHLYLINSTS
jgi:hypothetical protein